MSGKVSGMSDQGSALLRALWKPDGRIQEYRKPPFFRCHYTKQLSSKAVLINNIMDAVHKPYEHAYGSVALQLEAETEDILLYELLGHVQQFVS
jgi:hypothetical protein